MSVLTISQAINELYQSKISDNAREKLECDFIQFVKQVQTGFSHRILDLQRMQFGFTVLSRIPRLMRVIPNIYRLKFYGNLIRDSGLSKIYQLLQTNPQVRHLDIGSNDLSDDSLVCMVDIITNTFLFSLQLGSIDNNFQANRFTREGLEIIMDAVSKTNRLRCFGIGGVHSVKQKKTQKSKDFSKHIAKLLKSCTYLQTLDISKCHLVDSDQSILSSGFSENKSLKHLDLHENYFPSGTRLIDGIVNLDKLIFLNLSHCSLNGNACKALSQRLKTGWQLINLNISHNEKIGNEGISELLSVLPDNIYLVSLNICDTGFDEKIVPYLNELFQNNCILQELDLSQNFVGDSVSDSFQSLTLNSIFLSSCRISDVGAISICNHLSINNTLKRLSLKDNFLTKGIGYELVNILKKNEALTCVDLTSTQIDCFALEAIQTICARNKTTIHNNMLTQLRKEYIQLSIQDAKIPNVVSHLQELRGEHNQLNEEIEKLNNNIENVDSSTMIVINSVKKEIDEFQRAIATQESQIVEMQQKITEMNEENSLALKRYEEDSKKEQDDFDYAEASAEKVEKATVQLQKDSVDLQEKLNEEIIRIDEMLGEVTRITRNRKRLKEYEIPAYPYEEEERAAAELASKDGLTVEEKAERLAKEMAMFEDPYSLYPEEEEENHKKKKKKSKKGSTKAKKSGKNKSDSTDITKKSKKKKKKPSPSKKNST